MKRRDLSFLLPVVLSMALVACGSSASSTASSVPTSEPQAQSNSADVAEEGSTYTVVINDAEVVITVSADQKSLSADTMGMVVEGTCEVIDDTLTLKEQTSGNDQVWSGLAATPYTLNKDGTATALSDSQDNDATAGADAEELFAWDGYASLIFNTDGTYDFNYKDMVKESGTWTWKDWELTVIDAEGNEMTGGVDKEDNNTMKLEFTAIANEQLKVNFTAASSVWGVALGASGSYEPVDASSNGTSTAGGVAAFAGEYDLYSEEKDMYCEEFIIDEDGTVHGVVESSGLTSFEGTVTEDGTITAEVPRLGGTMTGTIDEDLQVYVHFEVRGSVSDFVGGPL